METVSDFIFLGSKITADGDCSHEIRRWLVLGRKAVTHLDSVLKSRDITLSTKVYKVKAIVFPGGSDGKESACTVGDLGLIPGLGRSPGGGHGNPLQYSCLENPRGWRSLAGYSPWGQKESDTAERRRTRGLPSGQVRLWELDRKEGRTAKSWYLQTEVPEKTPESTLDSKEIKPVSLKGDQPWIVPRRSDAEAEAPVFWSSNVNRRFIGKVPDAGKDWRQKKKRASEDEMAGWHHRCNEYELGQTPEMVRERKAWVLQFMGSQRVGHNWRTEQHVKTAIPGFLPGNSILSAYNTACLFSSLLLWKVIWHFWAHFSTSQWRELCPTDLSDSLVLETHINKTLKLAKTWYKYEVRP